MEKILKRCKCGVYLSVNEHKDIYQSVKDWIADRTGSDSELDEDGDRDIIERMIAADQIYRLQFYPDTPIGSYTVYGISLDEVVQKAEECLDEK